MFFFSNIKLKYVIKISFKIENNFGPNFKETYHNNVDPNLNDVLTANVKFLFAGNICSHCINSQHHHYDTIVTSKGKTSFFGSLFMLNTRFEDSIYTKNIENLAKTTQIWYETKEKWSLRDFWRGTHRPLCQTVCCWNCIAAKSIWRMSLMAFRHHIHSGFLILFFIQFCCNLNKYCSEIGTK